MYHGSNVFSPTVGAYNCFARRQFPCDNGVCVDRASLCDGVIDCEDNSDELNCSKCKVYYAMMNNNVFYIHLRCF